MKLRIATYNVENLFARAKILNMRDPAKIDELLGLVQRLQKLLSATTYTNAIRDEVFKLMVTLRPYVTIRKDAGSLGKWAKETDLATGQEVTGFRIFQSSAGRASWLGELEFLDDQFSDQQRKNTGKVIKAMDADILGLVEVEGMDVLKAFNSQVLTTKRYKQFVMIDSPNDPRGIDVACMTRGRITAVRTHVFDDGVEFKPVFSRDCLEVAMELPGLSQPVFVLCNHFKSQSGMTKADRDKSARKRKEQAAAVIQILQTYNLKKDYVVVLGDLNEDSANDFGSLEALFAVPDLFPTVDPNLPAPERYTYYFGGGKVGERLNQLDYIFLSKPLHDAVVARGFERRGIFDIDKNAVKEGATPVAVFPEVASWDLTASDHAGLWVELDL